MADGSLQQATAETASAQPLPRGIHHLALTTDDMTKTTAFYVEVLGMPLVHAMKVPPGVGVGPGNRGNPPYENLRHYFFDMGNDSLLAFFEIPKGEKPMTDRDAVGGLQHCAFAVTVQRFADIQARLKQHNVPFQGPIDILPGLQSIYVYDPSNIRLEFCCEPAKGERPGVIASVAQTKAEARRELETTGADNAWIERMTKNLKA
jgi:catechol 2,3-dioxygenase-like lactoylglutathione lyase family enzyme